MADRYGVEDLMFPPGAAMPPAAQAQPSLADLFQQGGVTVEGQLPPGTPQAIRGTNVPPSPIATQYEALGDLNKFLGDALQKHAAKEELMPAGAMEEILRMISAGEQRVGAEVETRRKQEFEAGAPGREMQAKIAGEQAAQPLALERIREQGRVTQQGQQNLEQLQHRLALERLQDTPFATGILAGRTPRDLAAMRPEQRDALLQSVGIGGMAGWGDAVAKIGTAAQLGTYGPPGSKESQNGVNYFMAILSARMTGMPIENFYRETINAKGERTSEFRPSGNMALKVGGVTPQVVPPRPGALSPQESQQSMFGMMQQPGP